MSEDNERRLRNATAMLGNYSSDLRQEGEPETAVTDALADLMHYCKSKGLDFQDILRISKGHFDVEVQEETGRTGPYWNGDWEVGMRRAYRVLVVCQEDRAPQGCYISCGPVTGGNGWPAVGGQHGIQQSELRELAERITACVNACHGIKDPQALRRQWQAMREVCEALPTFNLDNPDAADFKDYAAEFTRAMRMADAALNEIDKETPE